MSEPTQPAPERPADSISFPFNGETITRFLGKDVGLCDYYIRSILDLPSDMLAHLRGGAEVSINSSADYLTVKDGDQHLIFRRNDDGHLETVTMEELIFADEHLNPPVGDDAEGDGA
jgi:hypothetical protein